jgi:hypothetical protein
LARAAGSLGLIAATSNAGALVCVWGDAAVLDVTACWAFNPPAIKPKNATRGTERLLMMVSMLSTHLLGVKSTRQRRVASTNDNAEYSIGGARVPKLGERLKYFDGGHYR